MQTLQQNKSTKINVHKDIYSQIFSCNSREEKKQFLIDLSAAVKIRMELYGDFASVNEGLISMYSNDIHKKFRTFKDWKKSGFNVIKGSKAFFVWSNPIKAKKQAENSLNDTKEVANKDYKFFGMAYLFSNAQVEKN